MKINLGLFVVLLTLATLPVELFAQTAAVATTPAAVSVKVSTEDELVADVKLGPCKNDERLEAVKTLFKRLGVSEADIKIEKYDKVQNVVLTKKGNSEETVVVGAHYDKVDAGCGIIDNWSGIVIMAHLYRTLSTMETKKSYVFVAFDREELGLKGSKAMAEAIPKEVRAKYCTMVNFDSFGLGYPLILENASNSKLLKVAKELGESLKVPVNTLSLPGTADADSSAFNSIKIPGITLSALSNKWTQYMHQSTDKFDAIIPGSIRVGYLFGIQYISKMDEAGCTDFK